MTDPSRVRISGALQPFAGGFAGELARQGYTPGSLRCQLHLMAHVSRWLTKEGLDVADLGTQAEWFLSARLAAAYSHHLTGRALQPMLTYLRDLGVVPPTQKSIPAGPVERVLARYQHYLTVERGLGDATARGYVDAVRPFLCSRLSSDGLDLDIDQLREADVTAFVVARCSSQPRRAPKLTVTALRSLLGFLHVEGVIRRPMAAAVPSVAGWRLAGLPKGLEPDHVQRLLGSCDCRTARGRRDFAILTTLARLGLRAAEVATLRLEDIDWRTGELVVHGKGTRAERLPLPTDVGTAIAAYLRGRPTTAQGRTVFVRLIAPHAALSPTGVTHLVAVAARRAGLGLIHAHRLRHFAATQTLRAGASLSEIQQLLRHARAQTTAIYAKVDRDALRTIARPWLGGAA
jgi:integrase/recombinase XerD